MVPPISRVRNRWPIVCGELREMCFLVSHTSSRFSRCLSRIETLSLPRVGGHEDVTTIAEGLSCLTHLTALTWCSANLNGAAMSSFAAQFSCLSTTLRFLNLSGNQLGAAGLQAFLDHASALPNLKTLILCDDGLIDNEAMQLALAKSLTPNKSLSHLEQLKSVMMLDYVMDTIGAAEFHLPWEPPLVRLCRQYPLHVAAGSGDIEYARELIAAKADVQEKDDVRRSCFHSCIFCDSIDLKVHGDTPLHYAARKGRDDMINLLVKEGGAGLRNQNRKVYSFLFRSP